MSTLPHSTSQEALLAQQAFLRRLARSLVADEQRAEDLAQDAALEALRAGPARLGAMRAWLKRVVRNLATDADRRERLRAAREGEATPPAAPLAPDEVAQRLAAQREVLAALERLDEPYQSTLFLRFWDDLAPSAIARRTGIPVATVKTRLARGLARLRSELDEQHGGERKAWAVALLGGLRGAKSTGLGTTAAAVGGLAMGLKLALVSALVGGAAIGVWWWVASDGAEPLRTQVARAEQQEMEPTREQEPVLPTPDAGARTDVPASPSADTLTPELAPPATVLELELRGRRPGDGGTVAVSVNTVPPRDRGERSEHELADRLELDVAALFADANALPNKLRVSLDHPAYLAAETWALVPVNPAAAPQRIRARADLVRATTILTGSVEVPPGIPREQFRVAVHAIRGDRPDPLKPVDSTNCDPEGRYRLRADDASRQAVVAWSNQPEHRTLRPATRVLTPGAAEQLELEPLVIDNGERLRGRVTYEGGGTPSRGYLKATLPGAAGSGLVWSDGRFEWGQQQVLIDATGFFEMQGLAPGEYDLIFHERTVGRNTLRPDDEAALGAVAPDDFVDFVLRRVPVTVQVVSRGAPVPRTWIMVGTSTADMEGLPTNAEGKLVLWLDPRHGLEIKVEERQDHERKHLVVPPEQLTAGAVVVFELEPSPQDDATLVLQPRGPGMDEVRRATVDVLVRAIDEGGEIPESVRDRIPHFVGGTDGAVDTDRYILLDRNAEGEVVLSGFPPGRYFLRAILRRGSSASFVPPADFEVELGPSEHATLVWPARIGGRLRLNAVGRADVQRADLLTAAGERVPGFRPRLPGLNEPVQALDPGPYELRLLLGDGTTRTVSIQIEAGRFSDVEIDLDAP